MLDLVLARAKDPGGQGDAWLRDRLTSVQFDQVKVVFLVHRLLGHMISNTEAFLRKGQLGQWDRHTRYVFIAGENPANQQIFKMYQRKLGIIASDYRYYLLHEVLPPEDKLVLRISNAENEEYRGTLGSIAFTVEEKARGQALLRSMGVDPVKDWYVCIFSRDEAYHGEGDYSFRNADIDDYEYAVREILDQGGFVIRLGSHVAKAMRFRHPKVIDYALQCRSDFMDIYLVAKCRFVLGTMSGICDVTGAFDIPLLAVNLAPIGLCPNRPKDLYIPKRLIHISTGLPMTIREASRIPIGQLWSDKSIAQLGLRYINNTPEEIVQVTREMLARTDKTFQPDHGYLELLERHEQARRGSWNFAVPSRIGSDYLEKNPWLYV